MKRLTICLLVFYSIIFPAIAKAQESESQIKIDLVGTQMIAFETNNTGYLKVTADRFQKAYTKLLTQIVSEVRKTHDNPKDDVELKKLITDTVSIAWKHFVREEDVSTLVSIFETDEIFGAKGEHLVLDGNQSNIIVGDVLQQFGLKLKFVHSLCQTQLRVYPEGLDPLYVNPNNGHIFETEKPVLDVCKVIYAEEEFKASSVTGFIDRGYILMDRKNYQGAIDAYSKVVSLLPNSPSGYSGKAFVYDIAKQFDQAVTNYSIAIEKNPEDAYLYYLRARSREKLLDYSGAINDYTTAISKDPNDDSSYYFRGKIKEKLGDAKGAKSDLEMAENLKKPAQ